MIKIKVSNLTNGRYDYNFQGKANDLDIPGPYVGDFNTNVTLNKFDNQIILDAETGILANFICDRCARDFQSIVTNKFKMVYLFRFNKNDSEDGKDDVVYLHPETDKIELDKEIRDFAILTLPMKKLCTEDCKGLCPKCGKNLNDGSCNCVKKDVDPRWEVLHKLKTKNN